MSDNSIYAFIGAIMFLGTLYFFYKLIYLLERGPKGNKEQTAIRKSSPRKLQGEWYYVKKYVPREKSTSTSGERGAGVTDTAKNTPTKPSWEKR